MSNNLAGKVRHLEPTTRVDSLPLGGTFKVKTPYDIHRLIDKRTKEQEIAYG